MKATGRKDSKVAIRNNVELKEKSLLEYVINEMVKRQKRNLNLNLKQIQIDNARDAEFLAQGMFKMIKVKLY